MKSIYKPIGDYIRRVEKRNTDLKITRLLGLSMTKEFRETTSNIIGTDMSVYKVMEKWQFACDFMSPIRVSKLPVVLKLDEEPNLVSPAYPVFEILDKNKLEPEYLMMWFRRPEFDRYATFKCDSAIRGGYDWDELCNTRLPVPHIDKQKEIVKEYHTIINRINLNNRLIQKLEETAQSIYKQWFVDFEFPDAEGKAFKSNGGDMVFDKELGMEIPRGWEVKHLKEVSSKIGSGATPGGGKTNYKRKGISLVRSLNVHDFNFDFQDLALIDDDQAKKLNNVSLEENDVLLNITGVSVARCCMVPKSILPGRVNQHVSIIRLKNDSYLSFYVLCALCSTENKSRLLGISQAGSTREAITKAEIEEFRLLIPKESIAKRFEQYMKNVFKHSEAYTYQNKNLEEFKNILLSKLATIEN